MLEKREPHKPRCRCRRMVDYKLADEMVKRGEAKWFVVSRERGVQEKVCGHCGGLNDENCQVCKGTNKMQVPATWDTYTADIVLINHRTKSNRVSTSKAPTVESEHMERAYAGALTKPMKGKSREWIGEEGREARERIEEYGLLILEARIYVGPNKTFAIGVEPPDDPKTGTGRRYDFGRSL